MVVSCVNPVTGPGAASLRLLPGWLAPRQRSALLDAVIAVLGDAPPVRPVMPGSGRPFSVEMSNCGELGWVSDRHGYRYQATHPVSGRPWPPMPPALLELWQAVSGWADPPQACLVNLYATGARMGLHRDADEAARDAPVVSVSLGDTALFRVGGAERRDPTRSVRLACGDVVVLGGASRHWYHGVDRIVPGTGQLVRNRLPGIARINLTLRRVTHGPGERVKAVAA